MGSRPVTYKIRSCRIVDTKTRENGVPFPLSRNRKTRLQVALLFRTKAQRACRYQLSRYPITSRPPNLTLTLTGLEPSMLFLGELLSLEWPSPLMSWLFFEVGQAHYAASSDFECYSSMRDEELASGLPRRVLLLSNSSHAVRMP